MNLAGYLERIGFTGPMRPDLDCLNAVHRGHLRSIAYENLDVQLGRPVDQEPGRIFEKLVSRRRGGWCYEMNGLLGWALGEIGFDVMRMTGAVGRTVRGDEALGNHLVLCVRLGGPYMADVGLGDGIRQAIPLAEGPVGHDGCRFELTRLTDSGMWRFNNYAGAVPVDFDFLFAPADEARLARSCDALQSDPESMFRQNLVCQRLRADGTHMLLGRVLVRPAGSGRRKTLLGSADELLATLRDVFGLEEPDAGDLWPQVQARHEALFGDTPADAISFGPPTA